MPQQIPQQIPQQMPLQMPQQMPPQAQMGIGGHGYGAYGAVGFTPPQQPQQSANRPRFESRNAPCETLFLANLPAERTAEQEASAPLHCVAPPLCVLLLARAALPSVR